MLKSIEIRGFLEGEIPKTINRILQKTRLDISENRTDLYLLIQGCNDIGIKIRNSRLGIKRHQEVQSVKSKLFIDKSRKNSILKSII